MNARGDFELYHEGAWRAASFIAKRKRDAKLRTHFVDESEADLRACRVRPPEVSPRAASGEFIPPPESGGSKTAKLAS